MNDDVILTKQEWKIGDCQDLMREMDECSVDLIVSDPPYGYSFMGKDWDKAVPSVDIWAEALRILKPGAFAFIMSAPRQDVLAHNLVNLADAGFETGFTSVYWTYASGFPKASNISKMVDKRLGAEREIIGKSKRHGGGSSNIFEERGNLPITSPSSSQAKELDGSYGGFQPKPAVEVIMVVMKPLSEKTYVDQAMTNQKGITWLDDGRIPYQSDVDKYSAMPGTTPATEINSILGNRIRTPHDPQHGRFPANLLVSDDALNDGNTRSSCKSVVDHGEYGDGFKFGGGLSNPSNQYSDSGAFSRYFDLDAWWDERIKLLPKNIQKTFPFIITPKASKSEKNGSKHPTIKPVKLFAYLTTIGSREGDVVCDPFLGSGTELEACLLTNRNCIGLEISDEWIPDYRRRINEGMRLDQWL